MEYMEHYKIQEDITDMIGEVLSFFLIFSC